MNEEYQPTVPNEVRDRVYIGGLIVTAATGLAVATVSVIVPGAADAASQIGNAVLTASGIIVAGLGVVYRPGAQQIGG